MTDVKARRQLPPHPVINHPPEVQAAYPTSDDPATPDDDDFP